MEDMNQAITVELPPLPDGADRWNVYVPQILCDHSIFYNLSDGTALADHEGRGFDITKPADRKRFNRRLYEHRSFMNANRLLNRAECEI